MTPIKELLGFCLIIGIFPLSIASSPNKAGHTCRQSLKEFAPSDLPAFGPIANPTVGTVYRYHAAKNPPLNRVTKKRRPSPSMIDPDLQAVRDLDVPTSMYPELPAFMLDFKFLTYAYRKPTTSRRLVDIKRECLALASQSAKKGSKRHEIFYWSYYIPKVFELKPESIPVPEVAPALWKIDSGDPDLDKMFSYIEESWQKLVFRTPPNTKGGILPLPYEFLVPSPERFREMYLWDTYFGIEGLLITRRLDLAQKNVDNLLTLKRQYDIFPNGGLDDYLSRSQPAFTSTMVRRVLEETIIWGTPHDKKRIMNWLKHRAYPLLRKDLLVFWINPKTRFDKNTGLFHQWDALNTPRNERFRGDKDKASHLNDPTGIGITCRDTRAACEAATDFTKSLTREAGQVATPLFNSMIYKTMIDLSYFANMLGLKADEQRFKSLANALKKAVYKYQWNPRKKQFENYHLRKKRRIPRLTAGSFATLFAGLPEYSDAIDMLRTAFPKLKKKYGIMASDDITSLEQWDGLNGWAPFQMLTMKGAINYGEIGLARELAKDWNSGQVKIFKNTGHLWERSNVATGEVPKKQKHRYPPEKDFLWNFASVVMSLGILDVPLIRR